VLQFLQPSPGLRPELVEGPFRSRYWDYTTGDSVIPFCLAAKGIISRFGSFGNTEATVRLMQVAFLSERLRIGQTVAS
jgi:hypothetical protein